MPGQAEESLRRLQGTAEGVPHSRVVPFLGGEYQAAEDATFALLQYAGSAAQQEQMAATYVLLEHCLAPQWGEFQEAALRGKASAGDIDVVVQRLVEIYVARPWRPGLRLLGYAAANLMELEGVLLNGTGRDLATLSVRQICNLVYAQLLAGKDKEQRDEFIEDLYLDFDPEAEAMAKVRAMIAAKEAGGG